MRWFKPNLRSSIHAIFSASHSHDSSQAVVDDVGMEDIRDAMLVLLGRAEGDRATHVKRRIRYAGDVQALWFLRGDLMAVLAGAHGETAARQMLVGVSSMFDNLLPQGLRSRPSPLGLGARE
jgi:hypothetical protein